MTHQPYFLPTFLTLRVFALELIRKRLTAENENFISFRKHEDIKFPWVVVPFTMKNKLALKKVEGLLREKGFTMEAVIDYEPHHIMSNRRQGNKRKPFEHIEVEGLVERANWVKYHGETKSDEDIPERSTSSTLVENYPKIHLSCIVANAT